MRNAWGFHFILLSEERLYRFTLLPLLSPTWLTATDQQITEHLRARDRLGGSLPHERRNPTEDGHELASGRTDQL